MSLSTPAAMEGSARGYTEVKMEHFTYDWDIKEFQFLPQQYGECIYSPIFRTSKNEVEWKLSLYPRSKHGIRTEWVPIFICLNSHKSGTIKIEEFYAEVFILPIQPKTGLFRVYNDIERASLCNVVERSALCGHDVIRVRCEMKIPLETITEPIDTDLFREQAFDSQGGQLIQDFRLLYKEPKFCDIAVIVGHQKFPAHKVVLATRSPVFAAMFEHKETQENLRKEVKIENMEPEVVKAMLEFCYTDEVTNLAELAYGLLEAADKYDLQRLRSMCEKVLYRTLNKENAAEILVHADLHRSYKLKEYVMEFMDVYLFDVLETEGYLEIAKKYPTLLDELIRAIGARKKLRK